MTDTYRVTAPYVTVKVRTDKGVQAVGLYEGALLPEGVLEESIQHHLGKKHLGKPMIEKFGGLLPAEEPEQTDLDLPEEVTDPAPEPDGPDTMAPPPSAGPGSGQKAWAEYAVSLGYERDDVATMSRDDLIALCQKAAADG